MGRQSKLTEAQWVEIERRLLEGEARRALAREYGVSETAIRLKLTSRVEKVKTVAIQMVTVQKELQSLPITSQMNAQSYMARLTSVSNNILSAADYGAATAHRLSALANSEVQKIDDATPLASGENLRGIAALTALANESGKIALNLLAANKGKPLEGEERPTMTLDDFYGASAPQSMPA